MARMKNQPTGQAGEIDFSKKCMAVGLLALCCLLMLITPVAAENVFTVNKADYEFKMTVTDCYGQTTTNSAHDIGRRFFLLSFFLLPVFAYYPCCALGLIANKKKRCSSRRP